MINEAIQTAVRMETDAMKFYREAASKASHPFGKRLFEGFIKDESSQIYRKPFYKPRCTYLNLLICLCDFSLVPLWVIRVLRTPAVVDLLHRDSLEPLHRVLFGITGLARLSVKGARAAWHLDLGRFRRFLRKVR